MPTYDPITVRSTYLTALLKRYDSVTLPIADAPRTWQLHAIFQPLQLRRDPVSTEDLACEQQRILLVEADANHDVSEQKQQQEKKQQPVATVIVSSGRDALARSATKRLVILGGPGSGKTTVLKDLLCQSIREAQRDVVAPLPIFVALPDIARVGVSLREYLHHMLAMLTVDTRFAQPLWDAIAHGNGFICLDGLDEVAPALRPDIIALIDREARYCGGTWIVGSRFTEYKGGQFGRESFTEWELKALDHALRLELARQLSPVLQPTDPIANPMIAESLVTAIETHPQAGAWATNPLLFSLAVAAYCQSGMLPATRGALYHAVLQPVLTSREPDLRRRQVVSDVLAELALRLYLLKGRTFTRQEIFAQLVGIQAELHMDWAMFDLAHAVISAGVLEVVAHEVYGFRHQSFQEYLVVVALARRLTRVATSLSAATQELIWSKRTYSRWTEILRLLPGILVRDYGEDGMQMAGWWLHALVSQRESDEGDPGDLGLALTIKSLSEVVDLANASTIELGNVAVSAWVDTLTANAPLFDEMTPAKQRLQALAQDICKLSPALVEYAVHLLTMRLADDERRTSLAIIETLGLMGDYAPIAMLIDRFQFTPHPYERPRIARALSHLGERVPADFWLAALYDNDDHIREEALYALAKSGLQFSFDTVLTAMLTDSSFNVTRTFVDLCEDIVDQIPVAPLVQLLRESEGHRRFMLLRILKKLGDRAPIDVITPLLADERMRKAAALALGTIRHPSSLEPLLAMTISSDSYERESGLQALAYFGEHAPLAPFIDALRDTEWRVRMAAAEALALLADRVSFDVWRIPLRDERKEVRAATVHGLAKRGADAPQEPLLLALHDEAPWIRRQAVKALTAVGERVAVAALLPFLHDVSMMVREVAIVALAGRVSPETLFAALSEDNDHTRALAIWALSLRGRETPIAYLESALDDPSAHVRQAAFTAVCSMGNAVPLNLLEKALQRTDRSAQQYAFRHVEKDASPAFWRFAIQNAIGHHIADEVRQSGGSLPWDILLDALRSPEPNLPSAAISAMGAMGERAPVDLLTKIALGQQREVMYELDIPEGKSIHIWEEQSLCIPAIEALSHLGERVPLDVFLQLADNRDKHIRIAALHALGEQGMRAPIALLVAQACDKDRQVRRAAIQALGNLPDSSPLASLLLALQDDDKWVQIAAINAIGKRDDISLLSYLHQAASSTEGMIREAALAAFGNIGAHGSLDIIIAALHDDNNGVQREAIQVLEKLGRVDLLAENLPVLRSVWSKITAASILLKNGYAEGAHVLLTLLRSEEDVFVVEEITLTLGKAGAFLPATVLHDVIGADRQAAKYMRQTNAAALLAVAAEGEAILQGKPPGSILSTIILGDMAEIIGKMRVVPLFFIARLSEMLDWHHWIVRAQAAEVLGKIRRNIPDDTIRKLLELRHDPESQRVRVAANNALAEILSLEGGIEDD